MQKPSVPAVPSVWQWHTTVTSWRNWRAQPHGTDSSSWDKPCIGTFRTQLGMFLQHVSFCPSSRPWQLSPLYPSQGIFRLFVLEFFFLESVFHYVFQVYFTLVGCNSFVLEKSEFLCNFTPAATGPPRSQGWSSQLIRSVYTSGSLHTN